MGGQRSSPSKTTTTTKLNSLNDGEDALLLFHHLLPLVGIIVEGRGEPIHEPTDPTAESTSNIAIGTVSSGGQYDDDDDDIATGCNNKDDVE